MMLTFLNCADESSAPGLCQVSQDCEMGFNCVEGRCIEGAPTKNMLDSGIFRGDVGFAVFADAQTIIDSGLDLREDASARTDTGNSANPDAAPALDAASPDAGIWPDAQIRDAAIWPDAQMPIDAGQSVVDSGASPDATSMPDTGVAADSGVGIDAGPPPLASPGNYSFERVIVNGIGSGDELTNIAIAPDGSRMVVSERYEQLHIVEVQTQALIRTISLPGLGSNFGLIQDVKYSADGQFFLIVATLIPRSGAGSRSARLYRADADGQNLSELTSARIAGREFHAIAVDDTTGEIRVMSRPEGSSPRYLALHTYSDVSQSFTSAVTQSTSAGCEDMTWVNDQFGNRGIAYVCGYNGITLGHYDSTGTFVNGPGFGAASNTRRISARPQGDYALSIEDGSTSKLSRFAQGVWSVGSSNAVTFGHTGMWGVGFSDDGARALAVGRFNSSNQVYIKEYRHGFYNRNEITDVSIAGFDQAPYLGRNGVWLYELVWRPGMDCGYIVGGCSTFSCSRGYLIEFNVTNGSRVCP